MRAFRKNVVTAVFLRSTYRKPTLHAKQVYSIVIGADIFAFLKNMLVGYAVGPGRPRKVFGSFFSLDSSRRSTCFAQLLLHTRAAFSTVPGVFIGLVVHTAVFCNNWRNNTHVVAINI